MTEQFFVPLNMHHTWLCTDGLKHLNKTNGYYADWDAWDENFLDQVTGDKEFILVLKICIYGIVRCVII